MNNEEMMLEKKVWAVVGANDKPDKFGNKIYKKLKSKGYTVYPVNPNYKTIDGEPCYSSLSALPEKPDVVDMVVAPRHGKDVIIEAAKLGIKNIWFQPGTYNEEILGIARENNLNIVQGCVLVALK